MNLVDLHNAYVFTNSDKGRTLEWYHVKAQKTFDNGLYTMFSIQLP